MDGLQVLTNQVSNSLSNNGIANNNAKTFPTEEEILEFTNRIKDIPVDGSNYFNSVVHNIMKVQEQHNQNITQLKGAIEQTNSGVLDLKELMEIQIGVYQMTLSLDLTSKIASKVPNSVEVLMRG